MRGLWKLFVTEIKLFLREPEALFFTLIFPLLMLFIFGSIYGNEPTEYFDGRGMVDVSVPGYMAIIIATTGLMSIPAAVCSDREKGVLRRLRAAPMRPPIILAAWVTMFFLVTLTGALLLVVAGKIFYGLRFEGDVLSVFLAFTLSTFSFLAVGFVLASLAPTVRIAMAAGMVLFFPMMFLSGATIPWQELPEAVRQVASALPLTHAVQLLQGLWFGEPWSEHLPKVATLFGMLIVGVVVSAKTFRWEATAGSATLAMIHRFSNARWGRVLLAGVGASVLTIVTTGLVIGIYAMSLAIQAQGAPDGAKIAQFAAQVSNWGSPVLAVLLTVGAAAWAVRSIEAAAGLHGLLVGLIVALIGLIVGWAFGDTLDLLALAAFVLTVAAGWLGSALGRRRH